MKNQTISQFAAEITKQSETEILSFIPTFSKMSTLYSKLQDILTRKQTLTVNTIHFRNHQNIKYIYNSFNNSKYPELSDPDKFNHAFEQATTKILNKLKQAEIILINELNKPRDQIRSLQELDIDKYIPTPSTTEYSIFNFHNTNKTTIVNIPELVKIVKKFTHIPLQPHAFTNHMKTVTLIAIYETESSLSLS